MTWRRFAFIAACGLCSPSLALASTTTDLVSQLAGLFYLVVGLALTASLLLMIGGFIMWLARLGTSPTHRDTAIKIMEWSVATLFTLVLLLGVVEFVQSHTATVLYLIALVVVALVCWLLITSFGGEKKEEEE